MASSTSDEIIRLFKCYVETVTDVMKGVVDEKLLLPNHWTLEQYLEDKKHLFYHQTGTFKTLTCSCPAADCPLRRRTHTISQKVFDSLYDSTGNVEIGHEIKQNGRVEQTCIHKYVPKNLGIDDLDIGTMCFMLTTTATLSANEMSSVTIIRNCRNVVYHNWSNNHYSALSVNKLWTELESSLLTLTSKPYVQRMVKAEFLQHKNNVISTEDISEISEKNSMVTEDVNQLPSRSDVDNFKNDCLNRNKTTEATIYARLSEEAKTGTEEVGRNIEKMLQAISTNDPKHQIEPVLKIDLQDESKIVWHIENPDSWDLENVEAMVKDNTQLKEKPIKIKFVKTESYIKTPHSWYLENVEATVKDNTQLEKQPIKTKFVKTESLNIQGSQLASQRVARTTESIAALPDERRNDSIYTSFIDDTRLGHRLTDVTVKRKIGANYSSLIVDRRLERRLSNIKVVQLGDFPCKDLVCKITNCDPFNSLCQLQSESNIENLLTDNTIINLILEYIRRSHDSHLKFDLPCRYLLSLINLLKSSIVRKLHQCLITAISVSESQIAKAIAWKIVRMFIKKHRKPWYFDVWPGVECCCQDKMQGLRRKSKHCKSERVLIFVEVKAENGFIKLPPFNGVPVKCEIVEAFSSEAAVIAESINKTSASNTTWTQDIEGISSDEAMELFLQHRNLTLISKSPVKSIGFVRARQHEIISMPCIQLYCRVKGVIPVGEQHFPNTIKRNQTDVIRGFSQFLGKQLSVGDEIVSLIAGSGTLGGFVKYRGEDAFLTCAHVILPRGLLVPNPDYTLINSAKINVHCEQYRCGTLADHRFPPDKGKGDVSIDAAVIKLEHSSIQNLGPTNSYLNNSVLDYKNIGTNSTLHFKAFGAVSSVQRGSTQIGLVENIGIEFETLRSSVERVQQAVRNVGVTDNIFLAIERTGEMERDQPRTVFFDNQISFSNIKFTQGDSGMCIYGQDVSGTAGCIGMAIASHPNGGCIVTPMQSILSAFKM